MDFYEFNLVLSKSEETLYKDLIGPLGGLSTLSSCRNEEQLENYYNQLVSKYPEQYLYKDLSEINYNLLFHKELFDVLPTKYENKNLSCYKNYVILGEPMENAHSITEFKYITIDHKIILIFNKNINIGLLDEHNNIFIPQIMIKFEEKDDLISMINNMLNIGVHNFVKYFKNNFMNRNNFIEDINSNNIKTNEIKNNSQNIFLENQTSKDRNKNISVNRFDNILEDNIDKKSKKNLKPLQNVLYAMIDSEIIKRKMSRSLIENNDKEKYYLLNYEWIKNYIKLNNMTEIIDFIVSNKIIETFLNNEIEDNILQNDINVSELIFNLEQSNPKLLNTIGCSHNFFDNLSYINSSNDYSKIIIEKYKFINYYKDFILISGKTKNYFYEDIYLYNNFYVQDCLVCFGDNNIFIILQLLQNLIEIGELNDKNIFQPNIILDIYNKNDYNISINLLLSNGYNQYMKYYLLFSDDYISPIFNKENNIIGQAYRYSKSFNDYSDFIHKEKYLKFMIQLYFSNYKLNSLFNHKGIKSEKFFMLNEKYLQGLLNYNLIENEINKINTDDEINEIRKVGFNQEKFEKIFEVKKYSIIIKKILSNNNNFNQNSKNENDIPDLMTFCDNSNIEIFYYNNFIIIDNAFNEKLEENNIQLFKNKYENVVKYYFIESFILIDISKNTNSPYKFILEIGELKNKKVIPLYLLAYFNENDFIPHLKYILNIIQISFTEFINSFVYSQGNGIKFENDKNIEIGIIYKLSNELQNNNQYIPQSVFNSMATNNNNIINNINKQNANVNIVNNPSSITNKKSSINNNIIENYLFDNDKGVNIIYQSIKQEFKNPPLIGLKNVGATCYMNATLQCFCNIIKFIDFFKYKLKDESIQKLESKGNPFLTKDFKYLIENLWQTNGSKYIKSYYISANSNNKYFIPKSFKEKISEINPLFEGAQANDAKDLVNFLIMTLHEELNKAPKKKDLTTNNLMIDQTNRDLVFQNFVQSFINDNMSLISDLFYAMNVNITECLNCRNRKYNFQIYFFLNFPLEEVRKYKIQEQINNFINTNQNYMYINPTLYQQNLNLFQNNCQKINSVNLDDCFRYNQKMETFSGDNAMYCNNCQMQCNSNYQTLLSTSPEILVLILNRGKGIEFKVKCEFVLQLNLYEYVEMKNTGFMYELIGVVTHMGESGSSGHFIAYCKNPIDNLWYQYNDDLVFPVTNFVNEVVNYAMPYILFYQKINN
jgi:ubiquitin C-terminal hydrolase